MKIHEYQAKEILERYKVRVQRGVVVTDAAQAGAAFSKVEKDFGSSLGVIKAQIHAGGRGKGGGVKLVKSREEAEQVAQKMLGMMLKTPQTGPEGQKVQKIFVAEGLDLAKEFYIGIALDRSLGCPVMMVCAEGGVEIEEIAATRPEAILRLPIHVDRGLSGYQARRAAYFLGLTGTAAKNAVPFLTGLTRAYLDLDCSLAEINPLVLTEDNELVALDAKMNFDSSALYRHADVKAMRDEAEEDPKEVEASRFDLNYIALDGNIGCMVNGAGLAMATMDTIQLHGGSPANFLDVGGGATEENITEAFKILVSDNNVKGILVNIFGGIMRCDVIARGVIAAARNVEMQIPLVVRLEGTNVKEGRRLLEESGLPLTAAGSLDEAARIVCEAVHAPA